MKAIVLIYDGRVFAGTYARNNGRNTTAVTSEDGARCRESMAEMVLRVKGRVLKKVLHCI